METFFDRTLLPEALFEFVVVSDTHYMLDSGEQPVEFASRRLQSARAQVALRQIAALQPAFVVHLGDLVQEYPETPHFDRALDEALAQIRACGVEAHWVAGNHDVGDKTDPTMPTHPVLLPHLEKYHQRLGNSWYSFDCGELHGIVLNSQILNTALDAAQQQRIFLEQDLAAHADKRICVFTHLPPYLYDPAEQALGHYDNIDFPARTWLLDLLLHYRVEMLFAGHVHFAFCDQCGPMRYYIAPSTSFTRPGFSHLFTGPPPDEQGRNDAAKLGFYLCRVRPEHIDVLLVRTGGAIEQPVAPPRLLTAAVGAAAPLGLTLSHPLSPVADVPLAWPSIVRQKVRNDYPLLACEELGVAALRLPWTDLEDDHQRRRLALLRRRGLRLQAFLPYSQHHSLHRLLDRHHDQVDSWEIQLADGALADPACADLLRTCRQRTPLSLCSIVPGERLPGKQHPRTRIGFSPEELPALDRTLAALDLSVESVLCRLGAKPWQTVLHLRDLPPLQQIGHIELLCSLPTQDDAINAELAANALFATALLPKSHLYIDPLIDLDRTMDVCHGVLDTLCNPRPVFEVLRCLNALLQPHGNTTWEPRTIEKGDLTLLQLRSPQTFFLLLLSKRAETPLPASVIAPNADLLALYHLSQGSVEKCSLSQLNDLKLTSPTLVAPLA